METLIVERNGVPTLINASDIRAEDKPIKEDLKNETVVIKTKKTKPEKVEIEIEDETPKVPEVNVTRKKRGK